MRWPRLTLTVLVMLTLHSKELPAQDGFLITLRGDTLRGRIIIEPTESVDRVHVRTKKKSTWTARQIKRVMVGQTSYIPVAYDGRIRLMKILQEGYLSQLTFQTTHQSFAYDGSLLLRADGRMLEVPRLNFRRDLPMFLEPSGLSDSIASGLLTLADIGEIVMRYNRNIGRMTRTSIVRNRAISALEPARLELNKLQQLIQPLSFPAKSDAMQILSDLDLKFSRGENAPNYAIRALQSALSDQPNLRDALKQVLDLLSSLPD